MQEAQLEDKCKGLRWKQPFENNPQYKVKRDPNGGYLKLRIHQDTMCRLVFDPIVEKTIDLIENQIKKANSAQIYATFLLGGFGKSNYLKRKIEERFEGDHKAGKVIQDEMVKGETAAMRGAIYFGLEALRTVQEANIVPLPLGFEKEAYFGPSRFEILLCIGRENVKPIICKNTN
jgi:hypothetical protein